MKIYAMVSRDLDSGELNVDAYTSFEKMLMAFDVEIVHAKDQEFPIEECVLKPQSDYLYLKTDGYEIIGQDCQLH